MLVVIFYLSVYLISLAVRAVAPADITDFLAYSTAHQGGNFVFFVIGFFTARSRRAERYRIRSFQNAHKAEIAALKDGNKTQYTVIKNISSDGTDYRKLMRRAKANFLFGRILYLAIYAAYLVHTCITFAGRGCLGILIIVCLAAGFVLTALVYIYEFYLFRKGAPNQRLRRLKIAKAAVRVYSLLLIISASFAADSGGEAQAKEDEAVTGEETPLLLLQPAETELSAAPQPGGAGGDARAAGPENGAADAAEKTG